MADFALTNSGDLLFEEPIKTDKFKLNFRVVPYSGIRLQFYIDAKQPEVTHPGFKLGFTTSSKNANNEWKACVVNNVEEAVQLIKIRLRTELGELSLRSALGSELSTMRHANLKNTANLTKIQNMVNDAIKDILPDATITVEAVLGEGNFYCQNLNVTISKNEYKYYEFVV